MTKIISIINLKGGVGKTSLTINVAASMVKDFHKNVLIIDLDPQTNTTVSLISQDEWAYIDIEKKQTLLYMFKDLLDDTNFFDIDEAILTDVAEISGLDLLPSSLGLVEIQDSIPDLSRKAYIEPTDILKDRLSSIISAEIYDYILIDCPPNLGAITLNGITISNYYFIPMIPDILSRMGISLVINRINNYKSRKKTCHIELGGIIFNKVDRRTRLHNSTMLELTRSDFSHYLLKNDIPNRICIAEAARDNRPVYTSVSAINRSDYKEVLSVFECVTNEIINIVEGVIQ